MIVGTGPSGLSAAYHLRKELGHRSHYFRKPAQIAGGNDEFWDSCVQNA